MSSSASSVVSNASSSDEEYGPIAHNVTEIERIAQLAASAQAAAQSAQAAARSARDHARQALEHAERLHTHQRGTSSRTGPRQQPTPQIRSYRWDIPAKIFQSKRTIYLYNTEDEVFSFILQPVTRGSGRGQSNFQSANGVCTVAVKNHSIGHGLWSVKLRMPNGSTLTSPRDAHSIITFRPEYTFAGDILLRFEIAT